MGLGTARFGFLDTHITHVTFGPASKITETRRRDFYGTLPTPNEEIIFLTRTALNMQLRRCHPSKSISKSEWITDQSGKYRYHLRSSKVAG